ncbi:hypothetical protein [Hymenobacter cellulosivorans]|uniref:Lipoprotein n=1 Tax=Hymenobacter cellulosivorans TaxID=2932249 RepID=A0ABY4FDJ7_9BACT|nr:hypothetical protein [Hymenobacter cellulosivorans]UOQ54759.1 hypothetical protein MUN80_08365 [Hymenobacter cellulosivorans]
MKTLRRTLIYPAAAVLFAGAFSACDKNDSEDATPAKEESQHVRLLVADQTSTAVTLLTPGKQTQETFQSSFAGAAVYPTGSGRFAAFVYGSQNAVEFFDSGIEAHGDHVHTKGTPKWALTKSAAVKPAHFSVQESSIAIFGDGDGNLHLADEATLHTAATTTAVPVGNAHHGAVITFLNNTYAVSDKAATGATPWRVKIVNAQGREVGIPSTVAVTNIHGNATDGTMALFGTPQGILKVQNSGQQELIAYPAAFGSNWLSTLSYGAAAKTFVGMSATAGLHLINPATKTFTSVGGITQYTRAVYDAEGRDLLVLQADGKLLVFDGATGSKKVEKSISNLITDVAAAAPYLTATHSYVYITNAPQGKVHMLDKATLEEKHTFTTGGKPSRIVMIGADLNAESDH